MYSTPNTGMEINDLGSPIIALMKIYQTIRSPTLTPYGA
jgi:hypothetical protein